jgi:hypothetical protein
MIIITFVTFNSKLQIEKGLLREVLKANKKNALKLLLNRYIKN